jgi:ankyrin repeat protein
MRAAFSKGTDVNIVKPLLDQGAQVNARDNSGSTALRYARIPGRNEIVELLKPHAAKE